MNTFLKQLLKICVAFVALFICVAFVHSLFYVSLKSPKPTFLLLDRNLQFLAELGNDVGTFGYWPLPDTLPNRLVKMTLAAEDHRFYSHLGVDVRSIGRALWQNYLARQSYSGASTLAMQVARLQTPAKRTWYAKVREGLAAMGLTLRFGRERVLRHYLTIAPYGNSIFGVSYASRRYFQKPVVDLSWAEAALLAALPKAPGRMNPFHPRKLRLAQQRATFILNRALGYGWLSEEETQQAVHELRQLVLPPKEQRPFSSLHAVLAIEQALETQTWSLRPAGPGSPGQGQTPGEPFMLRGDNSNFPDRVGPIVRISLDLNLQQQIQNMADEKMPNLRALGASNLAILVLKSKTGEVLAYVGSQDYYDDSNAGSIDFAATPRSTGSLLKPFIYGQGMEWLGYNAATVLTDLGLDFGENRNAYLPENYDQKFLGPVLYKTALANSRNIPAIQVLRDVDVDQIYQHFADLGLTPDDGRALHFGLGLAIGGLYTSLSQLCQAYLALANAGKMTKISWVAEPRMNTTRRQVIRPDIARQLQRFLSDPLARLPSFPRGGNLEYPYPVAVKTGTSQGYRDAWTIGWSDTYLVGVWIGHHDNLPMKQVSGYRAAAPIVKEIFGLLHPDRKEGLEDHEFPPPDGYQAMAICRLTGKLADKNTPYVSVDYFKPGTEPTEYSDVQKLVRIDKHTGLLATPNCPQEQVIYQKFVVLDPVYKDWAISQGLNTPPVEICTACGGTQLVDTYKIEILAPRANSRFFLDPEMPENATSLTLNCRIEPSTKDVLWLVNDKEYKVVPFPYRLNWRMTPGKYVFQAMVPFTACKSKAVAVEVY